MEQRSDSDGSDNSSYISAENLSLTGPPIIPSLTAANEADSISPPAPTIHTMTKSPIAALTIAVEGCCHGELEAIYETIKLSEVKTGKKVDLLLICGDFQCVRDYQDLECVAMPPKYRKLVNIFTIYLAPFGFL